LLNALHASIGSKKIARRDFTLLQTGIGVTARLFKRAEFSLQANYYQGFKDFAAYTNINYAVRGSKERTGSSTTQGTNWNFGLALRYPIWAI
jgi:hypothetical protein